MKSCCRTRWPTLQADRWRRQTPPSWRMARGPMRRAAGFGSGHGNLSEHHDQPPEPGGRVPGWCCPSVVTSTAPARFPPRLLSKSWNWSELTISTSRASVLLAGLTWSLLHFHNLARIAIQTARPRTLGSSQGRRRDPFSNHTGGGRMRKASHSGPPDRDGATSGGDSGCQFRHHCAQRGKQPVRGTFSQTRSG